MLTCRHCFIRVNRVIVYDLSLDRLGLFFIIILFIARFIIGYFINCFRELMLQNSCSNLSVLDRIRIRLNIVVSGRS